MISKAQHKIPKKRLGPKPLPVHLGLSMGADIQGQMLGQVDQPGMQQFVQGIQKYQLSDYERDLPELPEVWRSAEVSIVRAIPKKKTAQTPILMIPSMINKSTVLDLKQDRSLLRFMAEQGREAYLLDWGDSMADPDQAGMEDVLTAKLVPAIQEIAAQTKAPIHVLGYCMGGTLLLAAAEAAEKSIKSLILLASPWDFHQGEQTMRNTIQLLKPAALPALQEQGRLSVDWLQMVFAALDPQQNLHKFTRFAVMEEGDPRADLFVAIEDWLNDGVDMPGLLAKSCLEDWYRDNLPGQGNWQVGGRSIDPANITSPTLIVAAVKDKLVSPKSSLALQNIMPKAEMLQPDCGHIGLIAGKNSINDVWQPMQSWLSTHD